jgi:hypothetical protein
MARWSWQRRCSIKRASRLERWRPTSRCRTKSSLRNGRLRGNELDAEISGTVALDQPQAAGALNLSGRRLRTRLLARRKAACSANLLRRRAAIPFRVIGSLIRQGFS